MTGCQCKSGFFTLRDCEETPIKTKGYTHVRRALGYKITQEMIDHDLYAEMRKLEMNLQLAGDDDLEVQGHLLLNNGFGTTDSNGFTAAGYDSLALFSTAHTRLDGGATQGNRPGTDANLDWTSLANAVQQFQLWKDNRGRPILSRPQLLIVRPEDELTACELLRSVGKPGTPNNEINALQGMLDVLVSPYITDTCLGGFRTVRGAGSFDYRWGEESGWCAFYSSGLHDTRASDITFWADQ